MGFGASSEVVAFDSSCKSFAFTGADDIDSLANIKDRFHSQLIALV
jgi:hypothetical protein